MGGLDTGEALGAAGGAGLLGLAEIVELLASVRLAKGLLTVGEDANFAADGNSSVLNLNLRDCFELNFVKARATYLVVTSDHDDADAGLVTGLDGWLDLGTWGIEHTSDTDESNV